MRLESIVSILEKKGEEYLFCPAMYSLVAFSAAVKGKFSSEKFEKAILGENHGIKELAWRWRAALITKSLLYAAPLFTVEASLVYGTLFATAFLVNFLLLIKISSEVYGFRICFFFFCKSVGRVSIKARSYVCAWFGCSV